MADKQTIQDQIAKLQAELEELKDSERQEIEAEACKLTKRAAEIGLSLKWNFNSPGLKEASKSEKGGKPRFKQSISIALKKADSADAFRTLVESNIKERAAKKGYTLTDEDHAEIAKLVEAASAKKWPAKPAASEAFHVVGEFNTEAAKAEATAAKPKRGRK